MVLNKFIKKLRFHRNTNPLKFFGSIGLFLISIGFLIGIWLVFLFITTGRVGHIPSTILTLLFFLIGIQVLALAFLADMWKSKK